MIHWRHQMLGLQPDGIMTLDKNRQNSLPGFPGRGMERSV